MKKNINQQDTRWILDLLGKFTVSDVCKLLSILGYELAIVDKRKK